MATKILKRGAIAVLVVEGKLSIGATVDDFRDRWTEAIADGAHDMVVDLSGVPMLDSSAIGSMIRCRSALALEGGKLKLLGANKDIRYAFRKMRLESVFEFCEKEDVEETSSE